MQYGHRFAKEVEEGKHGMVLEHLKNCKRENNQWGRVKKNISYKKIEWTA